MFCYQFDTNLVQIPWTVLVVDVYPIKNQTKLGYLITKNWIKI